MLWIGEHSHERTFAKHAAHLQTAAMDDVRPSCQHPDGVREGSVTHGDSGWRGQPAREICVEQDLAAGMPFPVDVAGEGRHCDPNWTSRSPARWSADAGMRPE